MKLVDATGAPFETGRRPSRVVSLVPSLTEAVFGLGAGDRIVGVTKYCVEPAERLGAVPRVGGTKNPDLAAVAALKPDVVIASAEENRQEDVAALREAGLAVFVTLYETVVAALDGIAVLALLLGVEQVPDWLHEAQQEVARCPRRDAEAVPYFCPIWRRPYMVARDDTYMADLLRLAGGTNAVSAAGPAHYNTVELSELRRANPAVILLPDEPYPFDGRHRRDFEPFAEVDAVRNGRIHLVDGKALTWYGPRIPAALRLFSSIFDAVRAHPDAARIAGAGS